MFLLFGKSPRLEFRNEETRGSKVSLDLRSNFLIEILLFRMTMIRLVVSAHVNKRDLVDHFHRSDTGKIDIRCSQNDLRNTIVFHFIVLLLRKHRSPR